MLKLYVPLISFLFVVASCGQGPESSELHTSPKEPAQFHAKSQHYDRFERLLMPRQPANRPVKDLGNGCQLVEVVKKDGKAYGLDLVINGQKELFTVLDPRAKISYKTLRGSASGLRARYAYSIVNPQPIFKGTYAIELDYDAGSDRLIAITFKTNPGGWFSRTVQHTCTPR